MSKTRLLAHIVFAIKYREKTLPEEFKRELFAYILGVANQHKCHLIRINGIEDHIHMLVDMNPSVSVAEFVWAVKQSTSYRLNKDPRYKFFRGWNEGYYAISIGEGGVEACRQYIINQEKHHKGQSTLDELQSIALNNGIRWDERDW